MFSLAKSIAVSNFVLRSFLMDDLSLIYEERAIQYIPVQYGATVSSYVFYAHNLLMSV
jgi:hypothetical protein